MLPFFYQEFLSDNLKEYVLDEATSKHCIQVLRMEVGDAIILTNGKGLRCEAEIKTPSKKHTVVNIKSNKFLEKPLPEFSLAIAFTKNKTRNEWLLEKITEMGISHIYPIISQRSERDKVNFERLNGILVAAMLQSQQVYLPVLHLSKKLKEFMVEMEAFKGQKFIAHCVEAAERKDLLQALEKNKDTLVLVGPEGDFSEEEIELCLQKEFKSVSFGKNRLRTETAGLYACTLFNAINNE